MKKLRDTISILLMEDERPKRSRFKQAASKLRSNVQLTVTTSLQTGLKRLMTRRYDIIFSNYSILLNTTVDFLREVRQKNKQISLVLITDNRQKKEPIRARNIHWVDDSLITPEGLDYVVQTTLKHAQLGQQVEAVEKGIAPAVEHLPLFIFFVDKEGIIQYAKGRFSEFLKLPGNKRFAKKTSSIRKIAQHYPHFTKHIKAALLGKRVSGVDISIEDTAFRVTCTPFVTSEGHIGGVYGYGIAKDQTTSGHSQKRMFTPQKNVGKNTMSGEQLSANISHEMRTPINAIMGFCDLLIEEKLTKRQLVYTQSIKKSGKNLLTITDNMLSFDKTGTEKHEAERVPFNLIETLAIVETSIRVQLQSSDVVLHFQMDKQLPTHVVGDSVRLSQVLLNLLSNAIKFTKVGSVRCSTSILKRDSHQIILLFKIQDTGIGIPKQEQKNVFERFTRIPVADETIRKRGGKGLGLAISKDLVRLQKGTIELESEENKGSIFLVKIPFGVHKGTLQQKKTHLLSREDRLLVQNKRVLLVEDNSINQLFAEIHLKPWNMRIDTAENGYIAIQKVKKASYDIILMDIQMPMLGGVDATRIIRIHHPAHRLPIIGLTAHTLPSERQKCFAVGMNAYITKPYEAEEIKDLIISLLKGKNTNTTTTLYTDKQRDTAPEEICNLDRLMEITMGDYKLLRQFIEMYLKAAAAFAHAVPMQYMQKDFQGLHHTLHKFINSVETFGIKKLSKPIRKILDKQSSKEIQKMNTGPIIFEICYFVELSRREMREKLYLHESAALNTG